MNTNKLEKGFSAIGLIIVLLCLAAIGAGVYYLWTESSAPSSQSTAAPETPEYAQATVAAAPTTGEFRSSLPRLVNRGDSLECDWRMPTEMPDSPFNTGKLWTMGNQGRSSINGNFNGVAMEANAIYKDSAAYTWMTFNAAKTGYKFSQSTLDSMNNNMTPEQMQQSQQIREEMIFNCRAWTPDPTKFVLPTDVTFKEL
jgi:hypothetical protein